MRLVSSEPKAAVIFEELGFTYLGPIDGHDYDALVAVIKNARSIQGPVLAARSHRQGQAASRRRSSTARTFHGVGPFELENGKIIFPSGARPTFSEAFGDALTAIADRDSSVIAITAAMPDGTKLVEVPKKRIPTATSTSGSPRPTRSASRRAPPPPASARLSRSTPPSYNGRTTRSSTTSRSSVCRSSSRSTAPGLAGDDGPTHMGLYDIAYLRTLPFVTIMAPRTRPNWRRCSSTR